MKIVINTCYGCYGLSKKAQEILGTNCEFEYANDRTNPNLVKCVEELGTDASGIYAELQVIEIPDDIDYYIDDYDGAEWVSEVHRIWNPYTGIEGAWEGADKK